ncbi:dockerin type I domain-containing protein [Candidatus Kapabacteria bacterium]|nr:dockerin type I domain-containing protein [Candidatus Kapabacteria bacterium]
MKTNGILIDSIIFMKHNLNSITIWIILSFLSINIANSQSVRLVRTDVDSTREGFVTSTYMFGFDLVIDNLENCNNASFRLKFDNAKYVKYSGAAIRDFGSEGELLIYENVISGGDEVILDIGVFSGQPLQENEFDNPNLVNLEFVVLPTAPDNQSVNFSFENAFGASFVDGVGQSIPLSAAPVNYDIHGFVQVWPGDSDRDGDVDNIDWTVVYENLKFKERFPGFRSFKRQNPSTLWKAQRALVWDMEDATYSDCDGDGEISATDFFVVYLNLTEDGGSVKSPSYNSDESHIGKTHNDLQNQNEIKIPIYASHSSDYYASIASVSIDNKKIDNLLRVEKGELFNSNSNLMYDIKSQSVEFTIGDFDKSFSVKENGIIAYLVFSDNSDVTTSDIEINTLKGVTRNRKLVDLTLVNSLNEAKENSIISVKSNSVDINSEELIRLVSIFNISGQKLFEAEPNSKQFSFNKSEIPHGFLLISIDGQTYPLINR